MPPLRWYEAKAILGAQYRRLHTPLGALKAITAYGNSIANSKSDRSQKELDFHFN
jgi:hypothetical protein